MQSGLIAEVSKMVMSHLIIDAPDINVGNKGGQMQDKKDFLRGMARGIVNSVRLAYERGVKDGEERREAKAIKNMVEYSQSRFQDGYERGLQEAWEAARRIESTPYEQTGEMFGKHLSACGIFNQFGVHEVLEKVKAWDEQEIITVGDEVEDIAGTRSVVMAIGNNRASLLNLHYSHVQLMPLDGLHKTGRHFDEATDLLEKLKGEK